MKETGVPATLGFGTNLGVVKDMTMAANNGNGGYTEKNNKRKKRERSIVGERCSPEKCFFKCKVLHSF